MDEVKSLLLELFRKFDKEGAGLISIGDLTDVFKSFGLSEFDGKACELVLRKADDTGMGKVSYEKFISWIWESSIDRIPLDYRNLLPDRFEVDISKRFILDKLVLGEGGYGKVFVARDKNYENRLVAVKHVTKTGDVSRTERFYEELKLMKQLDHPNICRLLGTYEKDKDIFFVMEYCAGGEVFQRIISSGKISEEFTADIITQVAAALRYAHARSIAHRDVKPENVVFCSKDPADPSIKLIDWGLGISFAGTKMCDAVGSITYAAPEVISAKGIYAYTSTCDLWSLGVLTYVMLCGRPPFWGSQEVHLERARAEKYPMPADPWNSISGHAKDLVINLMRALPENRLSIEQVVEHPWLTAKSWPEPKPNIQESILSNMRHFCNKSTFSAICITAVASQLDHRRLKSMHQVFQKLDKNRDGVLCLEEVKHGFQEILGEDSADYKEVEVIFKSLDLDNSDKVDYTEFCAGALGQHVVAQDEACWAAFTSFDTDHTGKISKAELLRVLRNADLNKCWSNDVCEEVAHSIIGKHDEDQDGEIDFVEWMGIMRQSFDSHVMDDDGAETIKEARLWAYDLLKKIGTGSG